MVKASSPVRLQNDLMVAAEHEAALSNRSAAEQVEHWASLGQMLSAMLTPEQIRAIADHLAAIEVVPTMMPAVDPGVLFDRVASRHAAGASPDRLLGQGVRFQACRSRPGLIERIDEAGRATAGRFVDGRFVPA